MVGAVLQELDQAGLADNTIVMFLSDHGMAFPGVKANCYPDSTRSPWIIRWPGVVSGGQDDRKHMLSCVDLQPTFLEAAKLPPAPQADGRSFLSILHGNQQEDRDYVLTQFFHIHGRDAFPMRGILSREWAYVFNPWADGTRNFPRQWNGFDVLRELARDHPLMERRVRHLSFRSVEEFYDLRKDPHCLSNLLAAESSLPRNQIPVGRFREHLREFMLHTSDPALPAFDDRHDPEALQLFMRNYTKRSIREIEELRSYEAAKGYRF
tara:strand:+ start:670 stop:1467 length:798 start_codon:yes stop_codon:yes gene_type:complete